MIQPRRTPQLLIALSALTLAATGCPDGAPDELPRETPSGRKAASKPKASTSAPAEGKAGPQGPAPEKAPKTKKTAEAAEPKPARTPDAKTRAPAPAPTPKSAAAPQAPKSAAAPQSPKYHSRRSKLNNGHPVVHVFDERERLVGIIGEGYQRIFGYDERDLLRIHKRIDGREEMFMYDRNRKLILRTAPEGDARYERDAAGRLLKLTTPGGRTWSFKHDGDKVVLEDGATGPIRHDFDAQGKTKRVRDASGRAQMFSRGKSAQGRWLDVSTATGETIQQRFDPADRLVQVKTEGHTIDYGYPTKTSFTIKTPQATLTYKVLDGGSATLRTPWGGFGRRSNARGKTDRVVAPGPHIFDYTLTEGGLRSSIAYPGGTQATFARDFMSRITKISHPAFRFEATYDKRHEQASRVEFGVETRFERDSTGRISKVLRGGKVVRQFGYDRDGNRTLEVDAKGTKRAATFDARFRITRFGSETFTHDAAGRLTSRVHEGGTDTFRYDGFGRLVEVDRADRPAVTYGYDGQNRLVRRTVNKQTTHFVWEGQKLLAEVGPNERLRLYVDGDDMGAPLAYLEAGKLTILHADNRGTVLGYSNPQGKLLARARYGIFGELAQVPADRPLFYGSHWVDPIARVIPMRARVYEPTLGRFLTPDPSGLDGGLNPYVYGDNDPVDHVDPQGLKATDLDELIARLGADLEEQDKARLVHELIRRAQARAQAKQLQDELDRKPWAPIRRGLESIAAKAKERGPLERLYDLKQVLSGEIKDVDTVKKVVENAPIAGPIKEAIQAALEKVESLEEAKEMVSNLRKVFYPSDEEARNETNLFDRFVALTQALKKVTDKIPVVGQWIGANLDAVKNLQPTVSALVSKKRQQEEFLKKFRKYTTSEDAIDSQKRRLERADQRLTLLDPEQVIREVLQKHVDGADNAVGSVGGKLRGEQDRIARTDRGSLAALSRAAGKNALTEDDVRYAETRMGNARRLSEPTRKRYAAQLDRALQNSLQLNEVYQPLINHPNRLLRDAGYDFESKKRAADRRIARRIPAVDPSARATPKLGGFLALARKQTEARRTPRARGRRAPSKRPRVKAKTKGTLKVSRSDGSSPPPRTPGVTGSSRWKVEKKDGAKKRIDEMFSR